MSIRARLRNVRNLRPDRSGLALLEFALALPVFLGMSLTGTEVTNFVITKMRMSQIALQVADNAARMGEGSLLAAKTVTETDINDVFIGADMQAGGLDLYRHGRVILSSLEPVTQDGSTTYKIVWQRCRGTQTGHASRFGRTGDVSASGIGPAGRKVKAQADNATMFVEVFYEYQPLVSGALAPAATMDEIASMAVRDRRDRTKIHNGEGAAVSSC